MTHWIKQKRSSGSVLDFMSFLVRENGGGRANSKKTIIIQLPLGMWITNVVRKPRSRFKNGISAGDIKA